MSQYHRIGTFEDVTGDILEELNSWCYVNLCSACGTRSADVAEVIRQAARSTTTIGTSFASAMILLDMINYSQTFNGD